MPVEAVDSEKGVVQVVIQWLNDNLHFDVAEKMTRLRGYSEDHPFMMITIATTILMALVPITCFLFFTIGSIVFVFVGALLIEGVMLFIGGLFLLGALFLTTTFALLVSAGLIFLFVVHKGLTNAAIKKPV